MDHSVYYIFGNSSRSGCVQRKKTSLKDSVPLKVVEEVMVFFMFLGQNWLAVWMEGITVKAAQMMNPKQQHLLAEGPRWLEKLIVGY